MFFGELDRDMILGRLWISKDRKILLYFTKVESSGTMDKPWEAAKILVANSPPSFWHLLSL